MTEIEVVMRRWGNSLGISFPKRIVVEQRLHENQKILVEIKHVVDLTKLKGLISFKKKAQEIKDEMRSGWE